METHDKSSMRDAQYDQSTLIVVPSTLKSQEAFMQCPICRVDLQMSERSGIEIDYCPQCRGIWLDRGELDKILERSAAETARERAEWVGETNPTPQSMPTQPPMPQQPPMPAQPPMPQQPPMQSPPAYYNNNQGGHYNQHQYDKHYYKRKKKKNFLEDLFDFD
jgi:Zn-finger nucleic acid-binding protein